MKRKKEEEKEWKLIEVEYLPPVGRAITLMYRNIVGDFIKSGIGIAKIELTKFKKRRTTLGVGLRRAIRMMGVSNKISVRIRKEGVYLINFEKTGIIPIRK